MSLFSQYSTVQYSTVQYSTVQYSTVQYSTVQYSTVQYSTVQYSTVQTGPVVWMEDEWLAKKDNDDDQDIHLEDCETGDLGGLGEKWRIRGMPEGRDDGWWE